MRDVLARPGPRCKRRTRGNLSAVALRWVRPRHPGVMTGPHDPDAGSQGEVASGGLGGYGAAATFVSTRKAAERRTCTSKRSQPIQPTWPVSAYFSRSGMIFIAVRMPTATSRKSPK